MTYASYTTLIDSSRIANTISNENNTRNSVASHDIFKKYNAELIFISKDNYACDVMNAEFKLIITAVLKIR